MVQLVSKANVSFTPIQDLATISFSVVALLYKSFISKNPFW
jgi:hypothetical protein